MESSKKELGTKVSRGLAFVSAASSVVAVLEFVSLIVCLKFWISTREYGVWGLVGPLLIAVELAAELGLTAAIIQGDDHTEAKLSTVFWINLAVALVFYGLFAGGAPMLAGLYNLPIIAPLMWVFGLNLLVRSAYQVPYALMLRDLRVGELSVIRVLANLAEVGCRIGFAAAGYGVWCFVIGAMARTIVSAVGTQLRCPWLPKLVFRPSETAAYMKFGLRSSAHKMLFQVYTNLDYHVVTFFFGPTANGIYKAAYDLVLEPIRFLSNIISGLGFAAFSRLKNDRNAVINQLVAFTRQNLVVMGTLVMLILISAEDVLLVLTTEEYATGAAAARILAVVGIFRALSYVGPPLLDGLGYPGRTLRYQVIAALVLPTCFVLSALLLGDVFAPKKYISVAMAWALGYPIAFAVLAWMTLDLVELRAVDYLRRIVGIPICMAAAGLAGLAVKLVAVQLELAPIARLGAVTVTLVLVVGLLLAYTQNISPRTVWKAIKG